MDLNAILKIAVQGGASDVHLKVGLPPLFRLNSSIVPLRNGERLTAQDMIDFLSNMISEEQRARLIRDRELDFSYQLEELGRFRVNALYQRQQPGLVLRVIPTEIKTIDELMLPKVLERIALERRGLVLVTGATGSGKSTTLAALLEHVNQIRSSHIITVEDPIEFVFKDRRSIFNQREVGDDTQSFARALRAALRQDPDVILVGEMRDQETIETAMTAAETGHLVFSTLHTVDAADTINRIINVFPPHQHTQIRVGLAATLRSVISQRLLKRADGRGRVAAIEVMIASARVRELLMDERGVFELKEAIAAGHTTYGMQTFDQAMMVLLKKGLIDQEEALKHASNPDDFLLRLQGVEGAGGNWESFE
ncbi:PilT/PilU family type 4a pilus ATPase [Myxococcota bacterium]|nr:PilT/PilU family type 4a pilus ATPase [Myxococcota bacterium]MBU1431818.1 PilT/PilU family type 4a pilus ATPase [Myxococcota bacterium]MBU1896271.1 PilT/PilU family type 4a pilus ATPase [Myxococcota bacterium]